MKQTGARLAAVALVGVVALFVGYVASGGLSGPGSDPIPAIELDRVTPDRAPGTTVPPGADAGLVPPPTIGPALRSPAPPVAPAVRPSAPQPAPPPAPQAPPSDDDDDDDGGDDDGDDDDGDDDDD